VGNNIVVVLTMDRNNYIEIHPTQAQVAKISYHHPSKYLNQNVSPQLQYLLFRIMYIKYHVNPEADKIKIKISGDGQKLVEFQTLSCCPFL
jgi:hypothetical protein